MKTNLDLNRIKYKAFSDYMGYGEIPMLETAFVLYKTK